MGKIKTALSGVWSSVKTEVKTQNNDFSEIFMKYYHNLKCVIIYGQCRNRIHKYAKKCGYNNIIKVIKFKDAVKCAMGMASKKDVVVLSPAASSFDEFSSYKERGETFKKLIQE